MVDLKVSHITTKDRERQVEEQFRIWEAESRKESRLEARHATKFITISREYGCAGFRVGDRLSAALNALETSRSAPWTVYDRKLIDMVCNDYKLNRILVETLDTQRRHLFGDYITGMFTGEPSTLDVFKKCAETIFRLTSRGNVIIIGRGGALITGSIRGGLHVRIVAPLEWRAEQVERFEKMHSRKQALRRVREMDDQRGKFAKDFLNHSLKDSSIYDVVLNQQSLGIEGIVRTIIEMMEIKALSALEQER